MIVASVAWQPSGQGFRSIATPSGGETAWGIGGQRVVMRVKQYTVEASKA
jgi:hypothetical protein